MKLLAEAEKSERENAGLIKKIDEYQDYAKRIHILGSEIDRLNHLNSGLEEDIKKMRLRYADQMEDDKKIQAFSLTTVLMAAEIESLRARVEEKKMDEDVMRKSILDPVRHI